MDISRQSSPQVSIWPPHPSESKRSIKLVITTENYSNAMPKEADLDFLVESQEAAYRAYRDSGLFEKVRFGQEVEADYRADMKVIRHQFDNGGPGQWISFVSLFLIPVKSEVTNSVHVRIIDKNGSLLSSYEQTSVTGGYLQLLLIVALPIELVTQHWPAQALYDANRAIILQAREDNIF